MEEKNNLEQQSLFDFDCKCPVCGKNCDNYQQLITHINRSRKEHMALKEVLAIDKIKALNNYTEFTQTFDSVKDKYEEKINELSHGFSFQVFQSACPGQYACKIL